MYVLLHSACLGGRKFEINLLLIIKLIFQLSFEIRFIISNRRLTCRLSQRVKISLQRIYLLVNGDIKWEYVCWRKAIAFTLADDWSYYVELCKRFYQLGRVLLQTHDSTYLVPCSCTVCLRLCDYLLSTNYAQRWKKAITKVDISS